MGTVVFDVDGKLLATAGVNDKAIRIWEMKSGTLVASLDGHRDVFLSVDADGCEKGELNPHGFPHQILSLARLPIPPFSRRQRRRAPVPTTRRGVGWWAPRGSNPEPAD